MSTKKILREVGLNTVCESARCPNIGECFEKPTATFMIMGGRCTRSCSFCSVEKGQPEAIDPTEPEKIAQAVLALSLKHVVITSVTRDDLPLGGGEHFAKTIRTIRTKCPEVTIEVLTPDFNHGKEALNEVLKASPDVFNHNIETIPRLYPSIRPGASYRGSLKLLASAKKRGNSLVIKSGFMLGLGEEMSEVETLMKDVRSADCDILTIGQYLRPSRKNSPVVRYVLPEEFDKLGKLGREMGFSHVFSAPYARSSFHAEKTADKVINTIPEPFLKKR